MTSPLPSSAARPRETLHPEKLGVWSIVFFVVAAAAPLVGMTGALPPAIALGNGAAAPGAYLVVGLTLLLFSVGYAAMSHRVTNAGAFFTYVGRGLGPQAGLASAFVSIIAYLTIQLSIYGFFGGLMSVQVGVLPWWGWCAIAWVLVTTLTLCQVDVGAKLLGVLLVMELGCLLITAVTILFQGGPEGLNFAASFNPSAILAGGLTGSAGIALAFAFASFIGFEASAIYGEEAKNPKTAVPRATYLAVAVITVLFALTSFAVVTGLGSSKVVEQVVALSTVDKVPLTDPAAVLFSVARQYVGGWMAAAMGVLVLSSLFAGLLAFQNSASRYLFALGRARALPAALGRVNRLGAPGNAAFATSAITGLVIAIFVVAGLDPVLNMFFWFSGLAVVSIVLIEILVCVAVVVFFNGNPGTEGVFVSKVAPVLAAIGLVLGEYLLMSRFGLLSGAVATGVDPTTTAWGLSPLGWALVLLPFAVLVVGYVYAHGRGQREELLQDILV
ncbi:MAG TPA: APC family permease [Burkholderiaceae bacterium]|nr:APC family permease [Burkholderiaceae bacterium]